MFADNMIVLIADVTMPSNRLVYDSRMLNSFILFTVSLIVYCKKTVGIIHYNPFGSIDQNPS